MIYTTITSDLKEIGQPGKNISAFCGKLKLFQASDPGNRVVLRLLQLTGLSSGFEANCPCHRQKGFSKNAGSNYMEEKILFSNSRSKQFLSGHVKKEAPELLNICLYCGSQNFLPEDEDSWINSLFQQENTDRKLLIQSLARLILRPL